MFERLDEMPVFRLKTLLIGLLGVLLFWLIGKTIFFFIEKPKITVDYVAKLNQMTQPENFDLNENAAPQYQKAFDAFVEIPDGFCDLQQWDDVNQENAIQLKNWLIANADACDFYRKAALKPYCWDKRVPLNTPPTMGHFLMPELNGHRNLNNVFIWKAHLQAEKGQVQAAFSDILTCYRAGNHKCRPNLLLIEQYLGLRLKRNATLIAFFMLHKYNIANEKLKSFQNALQLQLKHTDYRPSLQTEKLSAFDFIQRIFIDNGKGTGRLAWSVGWPTPLLTTEKSDLQIKYEEMKHRLHLCLIGPTRTDIETAINTSLNISEQIMRKTPWQIYNEKTNYFSKIKRLKNSHILFTVAPITLNPNTILNEYHQTETQTKALITVLAIMRYKNDTKQLPASLHALVDSGYLESIPQDPYSNKTLIYKNIENNFRLYSVGKDFSDNGGVISEDSICKKSISITVKAPDIVYWPIRVIEPKPKEYDLMY